MPKEKTRCNWCVGSDIERIYHDEEWGEPVYDDLKHFEFIVLDSNQAGLSWVTMLKKREGYRKAFANFDPVKVAKFSEKKMEKLLLNPEIIRNRLKVKATISNAKCFLAVQKEFGTFDKYIWQFTNGKTIVNRFKKTEDVPVHTPEAEAMSKDLKKRGFKFVGPTICYAYMQAAGMVNDHVTSCYRYQEVGVRN